MGGRRTFSGCDNLTSIVIEKGSSLRIDEYDKWGAENATITVEQ